MKKETKECIQIYIPLILAVSLNGLTGLVSMSDYAEGFLQGMALLLLCVATFEIAFAFKRRMKTTSKEN